MQSTDKKTISPIKICLLIASFTTLLIGLCLYVFALTGKIEFDRFDILLGIFFVFGASYIVSYYIIKVYIQKRLGKIYKAIQIKHRRPNQPLKPISMHENVLEQVSEDVAEWAQEFDNKVKTQTQLADYRRQFIGNFSHEIKTPIFNIQGYIDTLLDGAMNDDSIREKYLNRASKNVTRLISIVEDLTTISKLEYNQVVMNQVEFDLIPLIYDVFDELSLKAEEINISLKLDSHGNNFLHVKGDQMAIQQIMTNLIHNSIKYGKPNGQTTVNLLDMEASVIVQVIDDGIGIDKKHLEHLCDRFYRVSESRSRLKGGTGLGLSIVKHILEAHNQKLSITSVNGKGSTFAFQLEK